VRGPCRSRRLALTHSPPSERRVAELATAGYSDRDIAQTLFITANTVEMHHAATYHKLGITGRDDLTGVSLSCP
jgi:DNA-binding NarL/FixJ family response regulator